MKGMAEIKFKATRKKHSSGYAYLQKSGDLQYDGDENSKDGIWLYLNKGGRIFIDCNYKTKEFRLVIEDDDFKKRLF